MPMKTAGQRILIVDDTPENIDVLGQVLSDYPCSFALNGEAALKKVFGGEPPDLILLDIIMPGMDGYEVCRQLKECPQTEDIPIIFITAMSDAKDETFGLELGAVDYITKPINASIVRERVNTHLKLKLAQEALKNQNELLELKVLERTRELERTKDATIISLASLAETRDKETGNHIKRTRDYVQILAEHLRLHGEHGKPLDRETIRLICKSAPLHDIGKVGVRDNILLKPGALSEGEFAEMRRHTSYGRNALEAAEMELGENDFLRFAREIAFSHHERWDGTGYPQGLRGEEIPLPGRLMALADVYDALISKRVYKPAFSHEQAVEIMTRGDGRTQPEHFDPALLKLFSEIHESFRLIALKYADSDNEKSVEPGFALVNKDSLSAEETRVINE